MTSRIYVALALVFVTFCCVALLPGAAQAGEPGKSAQVPLEEQPPEFLHHVVWNRKYLQDTHFVPAPLLQEVGTRGLSMSIGVIEMLEDALDRRRRQRAVQEPIRCTWTSSDNFADHEDPDGRTMAEILAPQSLVARGKVLAVVPGWSVTQAMTMVYVEIEEILHCNEKEPPGRTVSLGAVVAGIISPGSFELDGLTLCSRTPEGFIMPKVGDEVVVGGWPRAQDPYYIGRTIPLFPVRDEMVLPQPYHYFKWDSVPLESLRGSLDGPHAECRERQ